MVVSVLLRGRSTLPKDEQLTQSQLAATCSRVELSLFLIPWCYLVTVAIAVTSLTFNAFRYLTAPKRVSTLRVGTDGNGLEQRAVGGAAGRAHRRGVTSSGWTSSFSDDAPQQLPASSQRVAPEQQQQLETASTGTDGRLLVPLTAAAAAGRRTSASSASSLGLPGFGGGNPQRSGEWPSSRAAVLEEEDEDDEDDDDDEMFGEAQERVAESGASSSGQETIALKDMSESGSSRHGFGQHTVVTLDRDS